MRTSPAALVRGLARSAVHGKDSGGTTDLKVAMDVRLVFGIGVLLNFVSAGVVAGSTSGPGSGPGAGRTPWFPWSCPTCSFGSSG